jgi:hypothetical protein
MVGVLGSDLDRRTLDTGHMVLNSPRDAGGSVGGGGAGESVKQRYASVLGEYLVQRMLTMRYVVRAVLRHGDSVARDT